MLEAASKVPAVAWVSPVRAALEPVINAERLAEFESV